jgi:hypothetical protein
MLPFRSVPEAATFFIFASGLGGLVLLRWRSRKKAAALAAA